MRDGPSTLTDKVSKGMGRLPGYLTDRMTIDRYLGRRLLVLYMGILASLVGAIWLVRILNVLDFYLSIGAGFGEAVFLCLLLLPTLIGYAMAPALLIALLAFYAGILNSREYYVLTGVGVSPFRIFAPVLSVAALAMGLVAVIHFVLAPWSAQMLRSERETIQERITLDFVTPRRFVDLVDGITIYTDAILDNGTLENILIFDGRVAGQEVSYTAHHAQFYTDANGARMFILTDGRIETVNNAKKEHVEFERYQFPLASKTSAPLDLMQLNPAQLLITQLFDQLRSASEERYAQLRARLYQLVGELLLPFMFAAIVVASVSGGELRRRGYGVRVGMATVIALAVFGGVLGLSARIGDQALNPIWAFVYPAFVILVASAYFYRQASRPPR